MTAERHLSTDGFAFRTAFFYAVSCILMGVHLPFFPVWLQAKGFDAGQVGAILVGHRADAGRVGATRDPRRRPPFRRSATVIVAFAVATAAGFTRSASPIRSG